MNITLIVLGAVFGVWALGFPGLVLGAGLGYALAMLLEIRSRLDELERQPWHRRPLGSAASAPPAESPAKSRYPEEEVIDAMQRVENDPEAGGAEMTDMLREVSGPKKE